MLIPATRSQEPFTRNSHEKFDASSSQLLAQKNANRIAQFMSCAGQFLCWNRAVFSCVQETCTRTRNTFYGTRYLSHCCAL